MQNLLKRATRHLLKQRVLKALPVVATLHSTPVAICSNQKYTFCSQSSTNFDRVSTYENLIIRISTAESVNEVLKIYSQNEQLLKNEHVVLCLRMMARLIRTVSSRDKEALQHDPKYLQITEKAGNAIESLNEFESLDFLFWMRKFMTMKVNINIKDEQLQVFYRKINEFLKQKSFNFRNLVNLYYDYSMINRGSHIVCMEILRELKVDNKLLTPFTVIQILQAASRRVTHKQTQEFLLVDFITQNFNQLIDEFDTDQKCAIFRYMAQLEMNFNPPKYNTPMILYSLRNQLKAKLDQLSESSVINIIQAYDHLPRDFPIDLIEEIKDMVIITLQHTSQNIKSFFLLDFIESILLIKRRRFSPTQIQILAKELGDRLQHDEYLQKPRNIERLVSIYDNGIRDEALLNALNDFAKNADSKYLNINVLEFLAIKKTDVSAIVNKYLSDNSLEQIQPYSLIRLAILLNFIPGSEQYTEQIKTLSAKIEQIIASEPGKYISISKSSLINNQYKREYMLKAIKVVQDKYLANSEPNQSEAYNLVRLCFLSLESKDIRHNWISFFQENSEKLGKQVQGKMIDHIFQQNEYSIDKFLVFINHLNTIKAEDIPLRRISFLLKDNQKFIVGIAKYDGILRNLLHVLTKAAVANPQDIRLQYIYAFVQRIRVTGYKGEPLKNYLKTVYESYIKLPEAVSQNQQFNFVRLLTEYQAITFQNALKIYDNNEKNLQNVSLKAKFFSYLLYSSNAQFREERHEYTVQLLADLQQQITVQNPVRSLTNLATYLSFPTEYVRENSDLLLKTLKESILQVNEKVFLQLIQALHPRYVKNHYNLYFSFIKELISGYQQYRNRLGMENILEILQKLTKLNCKYPKIYNLILEDIAKNFDHLNARQRIISLKAFGDIQIKQTDFFSLSLNKISENKYIYRGYLSNLCNSLYQIGYNETEQHQTIVNIAEAITKNTFNDNYKFIRYLVSMNVENEAQILEKWFSNLPVEKNELQNKYTNKMEFVMLQEFFNRIYAKNPEYAQKMSNFTNLTAEQQKEALYTNQSYQNNINSIGEYLKLMKLDFEPFAKIDNYTVDIAIPSKKILIKVIQAKDTNFDRVSFNGSVNIYKRIYESLGSDYKVIFLNNLEFRSTTDDMSKINLLVAEGIESNNVEGSYDFSQIQRHQSRQSSEAQSQASDLSDISDFEELESEAEPELVQKEQPKQEQPKKEEAKKEEPKKV